MKKKIMSELISKICMHAAELHEQWLIYFMDVYTKLLGAKYIGDYCIYLREYVEICTLGTRTNPYSPRKKGQTLKSFRRPVLMRILLVSWTDSHSLILDQLSARERST
jgi:hypothetical protein